MIHKYYKIVGSELESKATFKKLNFQKLDDETLLEMCIDKFNYLLKQDKTIHPGGCDTCCLCQKYLRREDTCINCPIYKYTGKEECDNTPFLDIVYDYKSDNIIKYKKDVQAEIEMLQTIKDNL